MRQCKHSVWMIWLFFVLPSFSALRLTRRLSAVEMTTWAELKTKCTAGSAVPVRTTSSAGGIGLGYGRTASIGDRTGVISLASHPDGAFYEVMIKKVTHLNAACNVPRSGAISPSRETPVHSHAFCEIYSSGEPLQEKEMTLEAGVRPVGYSCEAVKVQTCGSEVRKMHCNGDAFFFTCVQPSLTYIFICG